MGSFLWGAHQVDGLPRFGSQVSLDRPHPKPETDSLTTTEERSHGNEAPDGCPLPDLRRRWPWAEAGRVRPTEVDFPAARSSSGRAMIPPTSSSSSKVRSNSSGVDEAGGSRHRNLHGGPVRRRDRTPDRPSALYLTGRAKRSGWILAIWPQRVFARLMSSKTGGLADIIFAALVARREFPPCRLRAALRRADHRLAVLARGNGPSVVCHPLPGWRTRGSILTTPRTSTRCWGSMGLRPVDTPVVVTPTGVLRHPSPAETRSGSFGPDLTNRLPGPGVRPS